MSCVGIWQGLGRGKDFRQASPPIAQGGGWGMSYEMVLQRAEDTNGLTPFSPNAGKTNLLKCSGGGGGAGEGGRGWKSPPAIPGPPCPKTSGKGAARRPGVEHSGEGAVRWRSDPVGEVGRRWPEALPK